MAETSFGEMKRVEWNGRTVELMQFDEGGSFHTHEDYEQAVCLSGSGIIETKDGMAIAYSAREWVTIAPGVPHRMVPSTEPYRWLIFYTEEPMIPSGELIEF